MPTHTCLAIPLHHASLRERAFRAHAISHRGVTRCVKLRSRYSRQRGAISVHCMKRTAKAVGYRAGYLGTHCRIPKSGAHSRCVKGQGDVSAATVSPQRNLIAATRPNNR